MSVVRPAATEIDAGTLASVRGRRSEPILVPKLRIHLADFPYSHCSIGQRLLTSETCCGRGYDRRHEPDGFGRRIFKGRRGRTGRRTNGGALPGPRASRRLDRFQARAENPPSTRDDNSCRGPRRRLRRPLGRRRLVRWLDGVGSGISTRFPFTDARRERCGHVPFRIDSPACDCR